MFTLKANLLSIYKNLLVTIGMSSYATITGESGNLIEEQNFDAWGRHRNPLTWTYENVAENYLFDRGYTMHEHLNGFKLINMNGRMYDPVVARFLSVDPVIQFPENSQSYNRYSYVLNNPLRFTDPSGFLLDWFINEKTGDVYYNSAYNEGDVDKIEGEGWIWLGDDDIFTKDNPNMHGFHVVWQNQDLYSDYKKTDEYDKSMVHNDSKMVSFNVEASFKGQKALTFMKRQGYERKPKKYKFHENVKTVYYPDAVQITQKFDNSAIKEVLSYQYVNKNSYLNNTIVYSHYKTQISGLPVKYTWYDPTFSITNQSWTIRQDVYGNPNYPESLQKTLKFIEEVGIPWRELWQELWQQKFK